ncbi:MAG: VIT1/CCC1 transporter family protein [Candidatus Aenigmatarchaeota archaeon]
MFRRLKRLRKRMQEYNKITEINAIARRYFVMNAFDGVLTTLGIIIGSYFGQITDPRIILIAGFGAAIAMAVSGVWGAFLTEQAERKKDLSALEKTMLTPLKKTKLGRASSFAPWIISAIDGAAPFLAAMSILIPFMIMPISLSYYISIGIAFVILFTLGVFLGRISKGNILIFGAKMMLAGVVAFLISMLIGFY